MVADEQIIIALLESPTILETAKKLKITPQTIYNKLEKEDFKIKYNSYKSKILNHNIGRLQNLLTESINSLEEIATNEDNPPSVRIQAINTIFNNCLKLTNQVEIMDRLEVLERAYNTEEGV